VDGDRGNCVLPDLKQDLVADLSNIHCSGRTDVSDLKVCASALTPMLQPPYA